MLRGFTALWGSRGRLSSLSILQMMLIQSWFQNSIFPEMQLSGPSHPLFKFMLFSKIESYSKQRHPIPSFEDGMGSIYLSLVSEATISWPQLLHHHTTTHPLPASSWLQCPWDLPPLCLQQQILPTSIPICAGILPHGSAHPLLCIFVYPSLQLSFHSFIHIHSHSSNMWECLFLCGYIVLDV